jgi:plasmid stability protein
MSVMVQIRNVPEELHAKLKARAAEAGVSLSDYLLNIVREIGERPTMAEMRERLRRLTPVETEESSAEAVRAVRAERERT